MNGFIHIFNKSNYLLSIAISTDKVALKTKLNTTWFCSIVNHPGDITNHIFN